MNRIKPAALRVCRWAAQDLGPLSTLLYRGGAAIVRAGKNFNYDMRTNGEHNLLKSASRLTVSTVFDVGANCGEWSDAALAAFPAATVYAFEIIPQTFVKLQVAMASSARIRLVNKGLSDTTGTVIVNYSPDHDVASSMIPVKQIHDFRWIDVPAETITGDDYCRAQGIKHIDILKIDVEGAEPLVLRGFSGMLSDKAIDLIQFEYGMANIYSRYLLLDFYDMFERYGYCVGKLMPRGVRFKKYHPTDEDFVGPNYVAVNSNCEDIASTVREH